MKKIKIYGERNTGTNYLEILVRLNFHESVVPGTVSPSWEKVIRRLPWSELLRDIYFHFTKRKNFGWKHQELDSVAIASIDQEIIPVALVKNPY